MISVHIVVLIAAMLVLAVLVGAGIGYVIGFRRDQRQLEIMTERLLAEQRIEAISRATLGAMRDAVRSAQR